MNDMLDGLPVTDFELESDKLNDLATQNAWRLDSQLRVRFYKRAVLNAYASEQKGTKVFEDKVYVEILMPANLKNVIDREATEEDRRRFAPQFKKFVETGEQLNVGTPLAEMAGMGASQVAELRALKIETIEQLAGVADSTIQLIGTGGMTLKQRAIRWIEERLEKDVLLARRDEAAAKADALQTQNEQLLAELAKYREAAAAASDGKPVIRVNDKPVS